jgi:hypothetical protein
MMSTTSSTMLTGKRMPRWLAGATAGALVLLGAPAIGLAPASAATIGGFEIDGNFVVDTAGNEDWAALSGPGNLPDSAGRTFRELSTVLDNTVGGQDDTLLNANDKENSPPWVQETTGNVAGKSDYGRVAVYNYIRDDKVYLDVAFDRGSNSGGNATAGYWFELNQVKQVGQNPNPVRTNGDIKILLQDQGSSQFATPIFYKYNNGSWSALPGGGIYDIKSNFPGSVSGVPSWWTPSPNVTNGSISQEGFIEASFDLTSFGAVLGCPSSGFTAFNARSTTGNTDNNLQDYIEAIGITIPSECAGLEIVKVKAGTSTKLPGASFEISPNPTPGTPNTGSLVVTDGGSGDADGAANGVVKLASAKPGTYTVVETAAPAGYIKVAQSQQVVLAKYGSASVTFQNPLGAIRWLKTYGDGETPSSGATFSVDRTSGAGNFATITGFSEPFTVVDNGAKDEDPTMGEIEVSGLPVGAYTITETAAPVGYGIDPTPTATVTIPATAATLAEAQAVQTASRTIANPRLTGSLTVEKLGQPGDEPVEGATFALWKVVGDPDSTSAETDDVRLTDKEPIKTDADGIATVSGLAWGEFYYFEELTAPEPWNLPDDPYTDVEELTAQDATDNVVTVLTIDDPRSAIETSATPLVKLPGGKIKDQAELSGVREDAGGTITFTL